MTCPDEIESVESRPPSPLPRLPRTSGEGEVKEIKNDFEVENSHVEIRPTQTLSDDDGTPQRHGWRKYWHVFLKLMSFVGPGMMVSIAYMDPGNYSTAVQGGALKQFKLLFVILLSTLIALYLQVLAVRLGSVTGRDYARNCREHLPKWVNWPLWVLAEIAIISTDIAEVCGTAIALDILFHIPLIAGVFITIVDVLLVLLAWGPYGGMKAVRILEYFITALLLAIVCCFCVLLSKIPPVGVGKVLLGYVPSHQIVTGTGIQAAAGIMGATVMPHSLYLGSGTVVPRVQDYDVKHGAVDMKSDSLMYRPSARAIKDTLKYSVTELVMALLSMAVFVNSAILIVAGDTLYGSEAAQNADLYGLFDILKSYLGKGSAVLFMVALLCSGQSAGVICTLAGQMVGEGHINWAVRPWIRRLGTRAVSMIPCVIVVATVGRKGLGDVLNWSQVVLTITLPFLMSPLIYLTSLKKVMSVPISHYSNGAPVDSEQDAVKSYANHWFWYGFGCLLSLFVSIIVVYTLVNVGLEGP